MNILREDGKDANCANVSNKILTLVIRTHGTTSNSQRGHGQFNNRICWKGEDRTARKKISSILGTTENLEKDWNGRRSV